MTYTGLLGIVAAQRFLAVHCQSSYDICFCELHIMVITRVDTVPEAEDRSFHLREIAKSSYIIKYSRHTLNFLS